MKINRIVATFLLFAILLLIAGTPFPGCVGLVPACQPPSPPQGQGQPQSGSPGQGSPAITFSTDRQFINPGDCAVLTWAVPQQGVFLVRLDGQEVAYKGKKQVCPTQSTVYGLEADIGTRMERREILVEVAGSPPPPGAQGTAPGQPPQQGQPSQPGQPQQPGQQPPATPPTPGALPPGCNGAPQLTLYEVVPAAIQQGQSSTLNWGAITNGPGGLLVGIVTISPGGAVNLGSPGSMQVSPTATTTYTLTATGCGGTAAASVTLTVIPAGSPIPQNPPGSGSWSGPMQPVPGGPSTNPPGGNSWSGPQPNPPGGNSWGGPNSPGTIYDFMTESNCTAATWYASPSYPYIKKQPHPNDKFPTTWVGQSGQKDAENYEYSYTRWLYAGDLLEDSSACSLARPALLMRPPWASSSLIRGTYKMSNYTIGEKDYLVGKVGYINGVSPGTWVTADFKLWVNWSDNSPAQYVTVVTGKTVTGKLESFKVPLGNSWKGRSVSTLGLEVFAMHGTQDMRTVWVETKIIRE